MSETKNTTSTGRLTLIAGLTSIIGGFVGGGAEGLLRWVQHVDHLNETQRAQVLEVVKLTTDLDSGHLRLAPDYIQILYDSGNISAKVRDQLILVVSRRAADSKPEVLAQVVETFPQAVAQSSAIKNIVAPTGAARVYLHISTEAQRDKARAMQQTLRSADGGESKLNVLQGIELVPRYAGPPQVRYFFPQDQPTARRVAELLAPTMPGIGCQRIGGYENHASVRPQLIEVWLGSGTGSGTGIGSGCD